MAQENELIKILTQTEYRSIILTFGVIFLIFSGLSVYFQLTINVLTKMHSNSCYTLINYALSTIEGLTGKFHTEQEQ